MRLISRLLVASGAARWSLRRMQAGRVPRVTILAYHRIGERPHAGGDPQILSASAEAFAWQMDYLQRHFTPLSFDELFDRFHRQQPLPPNTALITFDDGYRDNAEIAAPLLRQRHLPAIIFLTTAMIGSQGRLWWDELYELLQAARTPALDLPAVGRLALDTPAARAGAMERLRRMLKALPEAERRSQMEALRRLLGAAAPPPAEALHMNWEDARRLLAQGVCFGAHTHTHPILTRIPPEQAEQEIAASKHAIEAELQQPPRFFAYPNGGPGDFDETTKCLLERHGFQAAVTLLRGSNLLRPGVDWMALRRIYIGGSDDRAAFIAKTSGALELLPRRSSTSNQPAY